MPAQRPISREYRVYLALWRKAIQTGEVPPIKCSSLHMAVAMRQGMYRAIKPFKLGEVNDEELVRAAEKYVVHLVRGESKSSPHFLELRERKALSELEAQWAELGIDEEDLQVGDERNVGEKLKELLEQPGEPVRSTPFYEREQ